jgi:hypothetical protein
MLGMRVFGDSISNKYPIRIRPVKTNRKLTCIDLNLQVKNHTSSHIDKTKKKVTISDDFSSLVAGEPQISNFFEGYEMVVELWMYMNR